MTSRIAAKGKYKSKEKNAKNILLRSLQQEEYWKENSNDKVQ